MDDQTRFAQWSGDNNPMHMDAAAARRTQAGTPAVHGMHALLWALDQLPGDQPIAKVTSRFEKFMMIDQLIELYAVVGEKSAKLELRGPNARTAAMTVTFGAPKPGDDTALADGAPLALQAQPLTFEQAKVGEGAFRMVETDASSAFPRLSGRCSTDSLRGLMALSALVGMVCPGLHSIFWSVSAHLTQSAAHAPPVLAWRTASSHDAFNHLWMETRAPGLRADVEAFMRPAPVEQPRLKSLRESIDPERYQGVKALIIGGSRGLGEVTAKILAAGGADVAITYATGRTEAQTIAEEFAAQNMKLPTLAFDARLNAGAQLTDLPFRPTHVLYFATSKIFRQKANLFGQELFDEFVRIYVTAFFEICQFFSGGPPVTMFYPSSVAVEERPRDMTEYAMAKCAGEALCNDIDRFMAGVSVLHRRLPRLATDQTATVTVVESVSSIDVMREIVDTLCPSIARAD